MEWGRNTMQSVSDNYFSRPNFVNQAETVFESPSLWTEFQESLNNFSLCNMSVSLKTEMNCPALAKPWKQGLINKGMRGNRSQLATQSYRGETLCGWQVRAVKIIENLWLSFNALNALKWKEVMEGENRLKPGTQSYTVARTCTDGDAPWQATLPGQRRRREVS